MTARLFAAVEAFVAAYRAKYQNTGNSNFRRGAPLYEEVGALNVAFRQAAQAAPGATEPVVHARLTCAEASPFQQDNSPCYVCGRKLVAPGQAGRDAVDAARYRLWRLHWRSQFALSGPGKLKFMLSADAPTKLVEPEAVDAALDAALSTTAGRAAE